MAGEDKTSELSTILGGLATLGERVNNIVEVVKEVKDELKALRLDCPLCKGNLAQMEAKVDVIKERLDVLEKQYQDDIQRVWSRLWWFVGLPVTGIIGLILAHCFK